jgi:hypothetical protein
MSRLSRIVEAIHRLSAPKVLFNFGAVVLPLFVAVITEGLLGRLFAGAPHLKEELNALAPVIFATLAGLFVVVLAVTIIVEIRRRRDNDAVSQLRRATKNAYRHALDEMHGLLVSEDNEGQLVND